MHRKNMIKYIVTLTDVGTGATSELDITTDNLEWSMEQYQRNRDPFTWDVIAQDTELEERNEMSE